MNITENSDEIVIRYIPFGKWITGGILLFIFSAFGIWFVYSVHFNSPNSGDWLAMPMLAFFFAAVLLVSIFEISLISMMFAPLMTVTISQKTKSVDIRFQRFYGGKIERFYFHQIERFKSYKSRANFFSRYFLALILANQKEIKLKILIGGDKQDTIKLVKKLNKFIKSKEFTK